MVFYGSELMHRVETVLLILRLFFLHIFILYYIIEFCSLQICPTEFWTYLVF